MSDPVFCPECRAEYLPTATLCAECGVALVSEGALAAHTADAMPPVAELVCIRASGVGWAQALSERLAAAGISHRIEVTDDDDGDGSLRRPGANLPYGVYVRPEDAPAAAAVDEAFMRQQIPDLPIEGAAAEGGGEEVAGNRCPACGASTGGQAQECPDCGLALL